MSPLIASAACLCAVVAFTLSPASAETPYEDLYQRDAPSAEVAAAAVMRWATERGTKELIVTFDADTFVAPPAPIRAWWPSRGADELRGWLDAFRSQSLQQTECRVQFATTLDAALTPAREPDAVERTATALETARWDGGRPPAVASFAAWAKSIVARPASGKCSLVLVSGGLASRDLAAACIRTGASLVPSSLVDGAVYWDEEAIIRALRDAECSLAVVAPLAATGEDAATCDIPQVPWASRPARPPSALGATSALEPASGDDGSDLDVVRDALRRNGVSDEEIEETIRWLQESRKAESTQLDGRLFSGGRFGSSQSQFFPRANGMVTRNADTPTGYGIWKYARVAAARDGRYFVYPAEAGARWLDRCPRDDQLLARLAPSLASRREVCSQRLRDPLFTRMLRIVEELSSSTRAAWTNALGQRGGWCGFAKSAVDERWRNDDLPFDSYSIGSLNTGSADRHVRELRQAVVACHRASDQLRALVDARSAEPEATRVSRTDATARLVRYWIELSAFFFESLASLIEQTDLSQTGDRASWLKVLRAIQLSDCLDAYDERTVTTEDDLRLTSLDAPWFTIEKGSQGNFLKVPPGDPNVRARRNLERVTLNLRPNLRAPAQRVIEAAESVMRTYGRTQFGWIVYYSCAESCAWDPPPQGGPGGPWGPGPEPGPRGPSTPPNPDTGGPSTPK